MAPATHRHRNRSRRFNKRKFRKRKGKFLSNKTKYGITKTVNHGGFYAFKEKTIATINITSAAGPAEAPNTTSGCVGGYNTRNGFRHSLRAAIPFAGNLFGCRQFEEYAELFEYWRITGVKIVVTPNADTKTISAVPASRQVPTLWYYFDNNKGPNTPLNVDTLQRKARVKYRRLDRSRTLFYKPSISQIVVLDPSANLAFANETYVPKLGSNDWIPTTTTSGYDPTFTQYSGLQWGLIMPNTVPGTVLPYNIIMTTYYEFKGNK